MKLTVYQRNLKRLSNYVNFSLEKYSAEGSTKERKKYKNMISIYSTLYNTLIKNFIKENEIKENENVF
ncbi:MAG: hypothetical protein V3V84_00580 [Candidatus Bathyarchaeia archaeon]